MQRRARIGALLLIGVGVVLGATVFRTDIAQATGLAQSAGPPMWTGTWRPINSTSVLHDGKTITLVQKGSTVTGTFAFYLSLYRSGKSCFTGNGGSLRGTAHAQVLQGTMIWPAKGGYPLAKFPFKATLSKDGRLFHMKGSVTAGACKSIGSDIVEDFKRIR
jgi:hypothetical protein